MSRATVTLATLLALSAAGNLYGVYRGQTYQLTTAEGGPNAVELTGPGAAPFVAKAQEAGASGHIECRRGAASNYPLRVYCADGGTAGFLVGNVLAQAIIDEVKAKLPGVTRDEVRLLVDADGKLWASKLEHSEPDPVQ